jgi:hypothetical protein
MPMNCLCRIAQMRISYCILYSCRQRQVDELLVWHRPDACLVLCVLHIEAIPGRRFAFLGAPRCMLCNMFCIL